MTSYRIVCADGTPFTESGTIRYATRAHAEWASKGIDRLGPHRCGCTEHRVEEVPDDDA